VASLRPETAGNPSVGRCCRLPPHHSSDSINLLMSSSLRCMSRLAWVTNAKPAVIVVDDGRGIPVNGLGNVYR
jgi:hypothetical protein